MADDFLGSIAQEDVEFVTEIVKSVNPGDNYKHLVVYTDKNQIVTGATLVAVKNLAGVVVGNYAEVTSDNYKDVAKDALYAWLTDYFSAGGSQSVYIVNVTDDASEVYSKDKLSDAFAATHQWGYFKSICIKDTEVSTGFHLSPDAAKDLAELCATDKLLSSAPLYPVNTALSSGEIVDTAYIAVKEAGFDAFWVYHLGTTRNGAFVALGLALAVINGSGTYVGNSFDMIATSAITASGVDGAPLDITSQSVLKKENIAYFKPVGDTTGDVVLRGANTHLGNVIPAVWIVAYCNYMNKVKSARFLARRNIYRSETTYKSILTMIDNTVHAFVQSGRIVDYIRTAPTYAALPASKSDEIIIPDAWRATYQDDLRSVSVSGTLYM